MANWKTFITDHKKRNAKAIMPPALQPSPVPSVVSVGADVGGKYAVYLAQCKADWDMLKAIPDHAVRDEKKPAVIDNYRQFLKDWMAAGHDSQNDCLVINLILSCDVKDWGWAMELAEYAIATKQVAILYNAEIQFKRDPMHIAADAVFIAAEAAFKDGAQKLSVFDDIFDKVLANDWVLNPSLKARYYKLAADYTTATDGNQQTELDYLIIADDLKNDIGVKGRIKNLQKLLDLQASVKD